MNKTDEAYNMGVDARETDGAGSECNPFDQTSEEGRAWQEGWDDACSDECESCYEPLGYCECDNEFCGHCELAMEDCQCNEGTPE